MKSLLFAVCALVLAAGPAFAQEPKLKSTTTTTTVVKQEFADTDPPGTVAPGQPAAPVPAAPAPAPRAAGHCYQSAQVLSFNAYSYAAPATVLGVRYYAAPVVQQNVVVQRLAFVPQKQVVVQNVVQQKHVVVQQVVQQKQVVVQQAVHANVVQVAAVNNHHVRASGFGGGASVSVQSAGFGPTRVRVNNSQRQGLFGGFGTRVVVR